MYDREETANKVGISVWTLRTWYLWQSKRLKNNEVSKPYLPQPEIIPDRRGNPKGWTDEMIEELKQYKNNIVLGRNGKFGDLSNPMHKKSKKYKQSN